MPEIDWVLTLGLLWEWLSASSPWLAPLGWIAIVVILLVVWVKFKGWAKVKAVAKWFQKAIALVDQLLTLPDDVKYIKGQLSSNGGSTVKDVAQTTAKRTAENTETLKTIERKVDAAARTARSAKAAAAQTQKLVIEHIASTKEQEQ